MPDQSAVDHKPRWRGVQHQWAALFAVGAGIGLVGLAPTRPARIAAVIYAASLSLLLAVSALYHRFHWEPGTRLWLRRADHASIYLLIGGTYTPIAMLTLDPATGRHLLIAIWCGVAVGVLVSVLWTGAPRFVTATIAVAVGWTIVPYLGTIADVLSRGELWLMVVGGLAYTFGALVYAAQRPDPWRDFGYHEVFHALTLVGAGLHLIVVFSVIRSAGVA